VRIAIATDAWHPQVNGVVRTLSSTADNLRARGHDVLIISPDQFRTVPCPTYPEIRLALGCRSGVVRALKAFDADAIHIATEGPIGWAARGWCIRSGRPFTTSLHTRFPDYVAMRTRLPADWFWPVLRRFHGAAARTFVATESLVCELASRGLARTHSWSRGVDLEIFCPAAPKLPEMAALKRPIQLYVGRVAVEKNIEAFLETGVAGTKVVVGDGPAREMLAARYPDVCFLGVRHAPELACAYASADLFVFPSRSDTFGLVNIEALASGLPVAAYPVRGPIDIIGLDARGIDHHGLIGALDEDLEKAIRRALTADPAACVAEASRYSWTRCTDQFLAGLEVRETDIAWPSARAA
jgi:glycosyltransferase involved in cell wall biosynthesis